MLFNHALKISYSYNKEGWNKGRGLQKLKKPLLNFMIRYFSVKYGKAMAVNSTISLEEEPFLILNFRDFSMPLEYQCTRDMDLSEASPVISSNSTARHKLGSSGVLVNNMDLKICDDDGNELAVGQKGEIVIRGGNVMHGYWKNETATKEAIKDGWLYTGIWDICQKMDSCMYLDGSKACLLPMMVKNSAPKALKKLFPNNQNILISACFIITRNHILLLLLFQTSMP